MIGRHQNVWAEVDVAKSVASRVPVVRRKSGGGCVYHDLGNINISFMTSRKKYSRKPNLELVANVLRDKWDMSVEVTKRDDIILNGKYKVTILVCTPNES